MPPSIPADGGAGWRAGLAALRRCLDELDAALQAGRWEHLDQLAPRVDLAMRELLAHPGRPAPADAEALRQTLTLANDLQARVAARRQQLRPLLAAWRTPAPADSPTP
ncbi:MAG TPA: hypothetical protein VF096_16270 [Azonexus sp.]